MSKATLPAGVTLGHIHLKVSDLDRAVWFYTEVLGFTVTQRYQAAADAPVTAVFLAAGHYHHHLGLNVWESLSGAPPAPGSTGLYHFALRYPRRRDLARAVQRVTEHDWPITGASDHGVGEAVYLRDPDGNGLELAWDRPAARWPRAADGALAMVIMPLDLVDLLSELKEH